MLKTTTLKNGIRIVTNAIKGRESVALGFWIGVGGRYEDDTVKGAAHFLEHIVFKGCRKYACEAIKEEIEGVGGALNAFTSEEQTCYYAKIPSVHLKKTFDVLSNMVSEPNIKAADVKKECTVICEEIKMYYDLSQYYVLELLDELMWPDQPLGKSLAGTIQSVSKLTSKDLQKFHCNHYDPSNIVVSACGKLKHEDVVLLTKKYLGSMKFGKVPHYVSADNSQSKPRVKFFKKDIEQMHLALGMLGYDERDPKRHILSLLHVILGGNMSSRLFVEIREKRGLAYSISTSVKPLHDTGMFMIRAGVDNKKIVETIKVILSELKRVCDHGVEEGEFKRAKDYLLGQLLIGLEDTMDHMLWIGESMISKNEVKTIKQVIKNFDKITREDIQQVAQEVLTENRYNLALVGPITKVQEAEINKLMKVS